jgi:hypothetical protein
MDLEVNSLFLSLCADGVRGHLGRMWSPEQVGVQGSHSATPVRSPAPIGQVLVLRNHLIRGEFVFLAVQDPPTTPLDPTRENRVQSDVRIWGRRVTETRMVHP